MNKNILLLGIIVIGIILFILIYKELDEKNKHHQLKLNKFSNSTIINNFVPKEIYILQSAENNGNGILTVDGNNRSKALLNYFVGSSSIYNTPNILYSMKGNKSTSQTIQYLNQNITHSNQYGKNNLNDLNKSIFNNPKHAGQVILICWDKKYFSELFANLFPECYCVGNITNPFNCFNSTNLNQLNVIENNLGMDAMWLITYSAIVGQQNLYTTTYNLLKQGDTTNQFVLQCQDKSITV